MSDARTKKIQRELRSLFPTARPRLIELAIEAISIHAKKNNDYTAAGEQFADLGLTGRLCDICRKVNRLHTFVIKGNKNMVLESQRDTAIDLSVFALLMAEDLERNSDEKPAGQNPD